MCLILGIESSCDETAASVTRNGVEVLSNVIDSQADLHKLYGGVVPEIASRKHIEKITYVVEKAIADAGIRKEDLDAVAVTNGPGLVGALLAATCFGKSFAYAIGKPLVPVNHIHGHIAANYVANPVKPPFVCLVASGGHSHIVKVLDYDKFEILGATRDDAAGEAFDKVARVIGIGYPGGPLIDKLAKEGDPNAYHFPRAVSGMDFSFSGVKTAVINQVHQFEQKGEEVPRADIAASFQQAVVEVLVSHTIECTKTSRLSTICLAGGVAANSELRRQMKEAADENGFSFYCPPLELCTDNGVMISCAGYFNYKAGNRGDLTLNAIPQIKSFE